MLRVAHLYQQTTHRCRAFLLGGLLYVKQATWVELGQQALAQLPLPEKSHHVVLTDRGLTAVKLVKGWPAHLFLLGRVKRNAAFYLPARAADYKGRGRRPRYGKKYRAEAVPKAAMVRTPMKIPIGGKLYEGVVYRGTFLRRGLPSSVELIHVEVDGWPPWRLMLTDTTVTTPQAVWAYYGRSQVEVAIGEGKTLGLDQYRGRRHAAIVRWPMIIGVVHSLLQLLAVGVLSVRLPRQGWPWYDKETTVGSMQRRLVQWVRQGYFSHLEASTPNPEEMPEAA
jgi:hypothetical protein